MLDWKLQEILVEHDKYDVHQMFFTQINYKSKLFFIFQKKKMYTYGLLFAVEDREIMRITIKIRQIGCF